MTSVPSGIYPMLYACFAEDGTLRDDAFGVQVEAALAHGAAGVAVLGLGTEVAKLSAGEREQALDATAGALDGRASLAVTVFGATPREQITFARRAVAAGATWLILQPPPGKIDEPALLDFFATVIDAVDCPVGIQNAPEFLGYGLSPEGIVTLARRCANFRVAKLECPAVDLHDIVEATEGRVAVFNGRCGFEMPENLNAGASGILPGIETIDLTQGIWQAHGAGDGERVRALYALHAPVAVSIMQGIPHFVTYGKALAIARLGLARDCPRAPFKPITEYGRRLVQAQADRLGPLTAKDD
ncbi:dihydrodipicolinate synthase family protein [Oceaniglobus trochenteri]|uniref:dihydrodipicolinate synthase family protein n=1 Tax=Oceaniglobus trochenteri TaxID=2763260 RepID=UPI001CFFC741|nr:dihydrodipicolinate synthase family protein [Oceaniglobus trochenteri]